MIYRLKKNSGMWVLVGLLLIVSSLSYIWFTPSPGFTLNLPFKNNNLQLNIYHGIDVFLPNYNGYTDYHILSIPKFLSNIVYPPVTYTKNPNNFQSQTTPLGSTQGINQARKPIYMEANHTLSKIPTFDNSKIVTMGQDLNWHAKFWKDPDSLVILIVSDKESLQNVLSTLEFFAYKGLFYNLTGTNLPYYQSRLTVEIFNDPNFLNPDYYNNAVKTSEYCNKILGVYSYDGTSNFKHESQGKWNCPINYAEIQ